MKQTTIAWAVLSIVVALACGGWQAVQAQESDRQDRDNYEQQGQGPGRSDGVRDPQQFIQDHDDDGDGQLDRQELPRRMRDQFERLDRNRDGSLTKEELSQHAGRVSQRQQALPLEVVYIWISDADRGHLSLNELQRAYDTLQKIDGDGNGELSQSELRTRQTQIASRWAKMIADRLDENDDGRVNKSEAEGTFSGTEFTKLDRNGNGGLSVDELQHCILSDDMDSDEQRSNNRGQEGRTASRKQRQDADGSSSQE